MKSLQMAAAAVIMLAITAHMGFAADPTVTFHRQTMTVSNSFYSISLATNDRRGGLGWVSLSNLAVDDPAQQTFLAPPAPTRLFELTLKQDGQSHTLSSLDFTLKDKSKDAHSCTLQLQPRDSSLNLAITLKISAEASAQSLWDFTFNSTGATTQPAQLDFIFPIFEGLRPGPHTEDIGYFFPREPGLMNDVPIRLATNYGQYAQTQLMAVFNDRWGTQGGGLYCFPMDTSLRRKGFELIKIDPAGPSPIEQIDDYGFPFWKNFETIEGVGLATVWRGLPLEASKPTVLPPVALGIHPGNWRQAFADYRAWVDTWYHPQRSRKFQEVFAFYHYILPHNSIFEKPTPQAALADIPKGVDQLHFMVQPEHVNGEYGYREDWGLAGIREFIQGVKSQNMLASHYLEGYIANEKSKVYQEHGAQWGQKLKDGSNAVAFANMAMCLSVPQWTDFLVQNATRLTRDLGLDVVYLDELGFGTGEKYDCHNPDHPHQAPYLELNSNKKIFQTVRQAIRQINPNAVLTTEGPVVDLWYNWLDGNEGYGVRSYQAEAYGPPIHFMRFLYPDFKYIDLRIGTPAELTRQMKQVLFNGTAADLDPSDDTTFDATAARILQENRDAFTDPAPQPNLPTHQPGLYCNRFSAQDKTLYTLWNDNTYPLAGACVQVEADKDFHFVELISHREAELTRIGQRRLAVAQLSPADVAVIARLPRLIDWQLEGGYLKLNRPVMRGQLWAVRLDAQGKAQQQTQLTSLQASLVQLSGQGKGRVILQLKEGQNLLDEVILPSLDEIDLAPYARATASNMDKPHGAQPESVIRKTQNFSGYDQGVPVQNVFGNWEYLWDDEPRPAWLQLDWEQPQTFDTLRMRFSQTEYAPQDYLLQISQDGVQWQTVYRSEAKDFITTGHFAPVSAPHARLVFEKGGVWGHHVQLQKLELSLQASR